MKEKKNTAHSFRTIYKTLYGKYKHTLEKKHSFISNKQMNQSENKINTTCFKQLQSINDK